ncbi:aminotransferase class I/II-fold pyridoxal phosphate-dependent enzyme [Brevibacillus laterosporus]|uniref:Aminotransferase class I/II-fold pyridoxal phosphate-dependent enzyme n=1 Tax=Brevibacillus halotolerans TaxID=1507437 RepID=A0ABT4I242_9BACL|nr:MULTISPECIES: aminotransferase class I/II-fold pyridoxal phosphate-dependent enzyme [Brevibacillus]MCR8987388.1 aminotransferase class I/II-fold pyridoxal phosphate-dependent enzyme [Brevibacillus laterosporus]MCZ0833126.1 aminotransferase class I/II-fold pyridoxal phosphate-dependent enzyme [Brevibacillus halotolerans]
MMQNQEDFWERQRKAPLFDALQRHVRQNPHPFHVPGHKMGRSFDKEARSFFEKYLSIDLTEITGLDDLHQPEDIIAQAQQLAAEAYGAEETKFLVGGTTVGNLAAIMSICRPGDKIIVQRNCHKSVYHGLMLAKAEPIFVVPAVDAETGIAAGVRREDVERLLMEHPDCKAVFLTNPTYYGMGIDLEKMATVVHRYHIPLIIDEAHGAHYGFHPDLPASAMQSGADISIQSTHKMGTAFTMGSMLHVQGELIDRSRLYRYLAMLQSSSPSYPLMASLDLARRHMVLEGQQELQKAIGLIEKTKERLSQFDWFSVAGWKKQTGYQTLDPLRIVINLHSSQLSGFELQTKLEEAYIYTELAGLHHLLLLGSTGTTELDCKRLLTVMEELSKQVRGEGLRAFETGLVSSCFLRKAAMSMHVAAEEEAESILLEEAQGRICAEMVIPYPPGIPMIVPGEVLDEQVIALLQELQRKEARFHGVKDATVKTIQVIKGKHC